MQTVLGTSQYSHKIKLGMSQQDVLEILGEPDYISEGEVFDHWKWYDVPDDESTIDVSISFLEGVVNSIQIVGTTPATE